MGREGSRGLDPPFFSRRPPRCRAHTTPDVCTGKDTDTQGARDVRTPPPLIGHERVWGRAGLKRLSR